MQCGIFFNNGNHEADYIEKCSDKMAVKICKSYKCLNVSNAYRGLPILNSFNFLEVYANDFSRNDQSQIINFDNVEFIFINISL